jgi:hypothetical protein
LAPEEGVLSGINLGRGPNGYREEVVKELISYIFYFKALVPKVVSSEPKGFRKILSYLNI